MGGYYGDMTRIAQSPTPSLSVLEKAYISGVVLIFGLIVLHAPLTVFLGSHFGHALVIKSWKEILSAGLLVAAAVIVTRRRAWRRYARDPFVIASAALALLYAVSLGYGHGAAAYGAGLLIDLRYILFAVLVYVGAGIFPQLRPLMVRAGFAGAVVVIGFGLLQFVLPKDFLSVLGYSRSTITPYTTIDSDESLPRLQSTLRGPNPLGAYALVVVLAGGASALRARLGTRPRIALGIVAVAGLIVLAGSYSRSAYIGVAVGAAMAAGIVVGKARLRSPKVLIAVFAVLVLLAAGAVAVRHTAFYAGVVSHDVVGSGPAVDSNAGHGASLAAGWAGLVTHPLGFGTGSTGSASLLGNDGYIVENQYLYVAHEAGWLALGLFVFVFGFLLRRAYVHRDDPLALGVFASGFGLAVVGLLLPVFADDTVSIVWFGLAALVVGQPERASREG